MADQVLAGSYDYVVVGAGSAGCVLANRLSADPNVSVALLEAGGRDTNPWIHVPAGYYRNVLNPKITWQFGSGPEPYLGGRTINWPRGRVLGGTSAINGLLYVRGDGRLVCLELIQCRVVVFRCVAVFQTGRASGAWSG